MWTSGSYTCGEPRITYELVESLCCTHKTNVTLCVSYAQIKKINKIKITIVLVKEEKQNVLTYFKMVTFLLPLLEARRDFSLIFIVRAWLNSYR